MKQYHSDAPNTTFVLVSHNAHKIREIRLLLQTICPQAQLLCAADVGLGEAVEETGTTFEENALLKARLAAQAGYIGIADDSGLCVDALHGAPGVYSARFAGEPCDDRKNNEKLLHALQGITAPYRTARFVSVLAMVFADNSAPLVARGECSGVLLDAPRGEGGFGYDPLFYYPPLQKTFAQLTQSEKNQISHRARAMERFGTLLREKFGGGGNAVIKQ